MSQKDEEIARLREQRDELLEALRDAERWLKGWAIAEPYLSRIRAVIFSAVIAKAQRNEKDA